MSKKLLISNNGSVSIDVPLPTISDGLVCFLDGRSKGSGSRWTDLSGNNNHVYYSNAKEQRGIIFKDGGMYFQKNGDFGATVNNPIKNLSKYAIEITFKFEGEFEAGILGLDIFSIQLADEINVRFGELMTSTMDMSNVNLREQVTFLMTFNDADRLAVYTNGKYEFQFLFGNNLISNCNNLILGCSKKKNEDTYIGEVGKGNLYIYSVKIYNRKLTEKEILQSYEEEKSIVRR